MWEDYKWYGLQDAADFLGVEKKRVRSLLKEHSLAAARRDPDHPLEIPEPFLRDASGNPGPLDSLKGTVILLLDGGYSEDEAVEWLLSPNDSLAGQTPLTALTQGRKKEVRRVASGSIF